MRSDEPAPDFPDEGDSERVALLGHAGPYFPYDIEDPRAPIKEKRPPGFVTEYDYVTRAGVVKQYTRRRSPKRPTKKR